MNSRRSCHIRIACDRPKKVVARYFFDSYEIRITERQSDARSYTGIFDELTSKGLRQSRRSCASQNVNPRHQTFTIESSRFPTTSLRSFLPPVLLCQLPKPQQGDGSWELGLLPVPGCGLPFRVGLFHVCSSGTDPPARSLPVRTILGLYLSDRQLPWSRSCFFPLRDPQAPAHFLLIAHRTPE